MGKQTICSDSDVVTLILNDYKFRRWGNRWKCFTSNGVTVWMGEYRDTIYRAALDGMEHLIKAKDSKS